MLENFSFVGTKGAGDAQEGGGYSRPSGASPARDRGVPPARGDKGRKPVHPDYDEHQGGVPF